MIASLKFGSVMVSLGIQYIMNVYKRFDCLCWLIIMDLLFLFTLNSTHYKMMLNVNSISKLFILIIFMFFIFGVDIYKSILPSLFLTCYSCLHRNPWHLLFCLLSSGFYILDWNESSLVFPYPSYQGMLLGSLLNTAIDIFVSTKHK